MQKEHKKGDAGCPLYGDSGNLKELAVKEMCTKPPDSVSYQGKEKANALFSIFSSLTENVLKLPLSSPADEPGWANFLEDQRMCRASPSVPAYPAWRLTINTA